jgi:hypothetical protein
MGKKTTQLKISVDTHGFIKEKIGGSVTSPFLAIVEETGLRHSVHVPPGDYELTLDDDGSIAQMTPSYLRISCEQVKVDGEICTNVWVGDHWE